MDVYTLCLKLLNQLNIRDSTTNSETTGLAETVWMFNNSELKEYTNNVIAEIVPEIFEAIRSLKDD